MLYIDEMNTELLSHIMSRACKWASRVGPVRANWAFPENRARKIEAQPSSK